MSPPDPPPSHAPGEPAPDVPPDDLEEIDAYAGTDLDRLRIVKAIVALANTRGGRIVVRAIEAGHRELQPAALEGLLNRYIGPPLHGLLIAPRDGGVHITVPESPRKPHVIVETGRYRQDGETKLAFHRGQIWVRRGRASTVARPDDLQRILLDAAGRLLERIGTQIRAPGFVLQETGDGAQPVRLVTDPSAPLVRADLDALYPLTRQKLCDEFERDYSWIAAAMKKLGVETSPELAYADRNAVGHPTRWRYAESVRDLLRARLQRQPDWDPAHE